MAVYLILMALVLVLAYPLIEHKPNVVKKLCYVIVTFGAMYLISVFRYGLGNDYYSYIYIFWNIKNAPGLSIFNYGYEPGFTIVTKLISMFTADVNIMYAVYALLILIPTAYAIFRYSENIWMSTMMFISLTFFYCSLSFIRQSIAFAIILCAYRFMKERNHFMVLLFIFLACLFHSTVIVLIPLYLIAAFIKPTKITVPIYAILTALVYLLSWPILRLAVVLLPQYKGYLELSFITQGYSPVYIIVPAIITALALIAHFTGYGKAYPKESALFTNFAVFNFIIWFIATKHFVIERFSMYLYIMMIMFIPSIARYYMNCAKAYLARRKNPDAVVEFDKTVDEVIRSKHPEKYAHNAGTEPKKEKAVSQPVPEKAEAELSDIEKEKQRILAEIMAEDGGDSDIATKPVEAVENKKPEKQKKYSSVFGEQFKADERYMPKNRVFKKRRNGFVNFVTRPVTIFAAFLAVVVGANLWYNYFGLTVSEKGFHGVMPYKSIVPQYTEFVLSKESKDEKNTNLRSEDNFLNYMYRLKEGENFTAIISARGDVTGGYNDGALSAVKELGLEKLLTAQKNQRYIAIIEGGKVVREELSKDRIDTGVIDVLGYKTQIISDAGESIVKMGNKNYSLNERGMNIVVLDNTTRNIVDKVRFKTYYVMLSATR